MAYPPPQGDYPPPPSGGAPSSGGKQVNCCLLICLCAINLSCLAVYLKEGSCTNQVLINGILTLFLLNGFHTIWYFCCRK